MEEGPRLDGTEPAATSGGPALTLGASLGDRKAAGPAIAPGAGLALSARAAQRASPTSPGRCSGRGCVGDRVAGWAEGQGRSQGPPPSPQPCGVLAGPHTDPWAREEGWLSHTWPHTPPHMPPHTEGRFNQTTSTASKMRGEEGNAIVLKIKF